MKFVIAQDAKIWRILESLSRTSSITKTSIELGLSLSNTSKLLSKLEKELGVKLIDRLSRPISLTEEARKLLPTAIHFIESADKIEQEVSSLKKLPDRPLVFSLATTSVSSHVLKFIEEYKLNNPGVDIEIRTGLNHEDLLNGKTDISVVSYSPSSPKLVKLSAGSCYNFMVATPKYIKENGFPRSIEDLDGHVLILRKKDFYPECRRLFNKDLVFDLDSLTLRREGEDHILKKFSADNLKIKRIYSSDYSSFASVLDSAGIAVDIPVSFLEEKLNNGELIPVLTDWHRAPWKKNIVYRSSVKRNSPIEKFARWYRDVERIDAEKRWKSIFKKFSVPLP